MGCSECFDNRFCKLRSGIHFTQKTQKCHVDLVSIMKLVKFKSAVIYLIINQEKNQVFRLVLRTVSLLELAASTVVGLVPRRSTLSTITKSCIYCGERVSC